MKIQPDDIQIRRQNDFFFKTKRLAGKKKIILDEYFAKSAS